MIGPSDVQELRASLRNWKGPGLPTTLSVDCASLLGVSDVTISFFGASDRFTIAASSTEARTLDEWGFTLNEGPSIDAAATSTSNVTETAPSNGSPWPSLSARARALGYRSIAGIPLGIADNTFATMTLHNRDASITAENVADAEFLAGAIAWLMLISLSQLPSSTDHATNHDEFHQATGMVMQQAGTGVVAAAELLRAHARNHNRLVTDVANDVVSRIIDFEPNGKQSG